MGDDRRVRVRANGQTGCVHLVMGRGGVVAQPVYPAVDALEPPGAGVVGKERPAKSTVLRLLGRKVAVLIRSLEMQAGVLCVVTHWFNYTELTPDIATLDRGCSRASRRQRIS